LHELVPPALARAPVFPLDTAIFIFIEENRSAEIKYGEKRIIVEVVDRCTRRFTERGRFIHMPIAIEEGTHLLSWDSALVLGMLRAEQLRIEILSGLLKLSVSWLYSKVDEA
jgi:hypothetical protein